MLLLKDFLVASLHKVGLEGDGDLDVYVGIDVLLRDELDLCVVLRDFVIGEQVE